jgi:ABC-type branched-subunit amino acid transport system ATPase component
LTLVEARGLIAGYGTVPVVRDVDLAVEAGEVVALLGPNGAGKSTTLRALSGILPSQDGMVLWDSLPTQAPLHRRAKSGLAYIAEQRSVFSRLSTIDNIRVAGVERSTVEALFPELKARMNVRVGELSGGEQRMLAVAQAIARRPRMLFADELSLGLAPIVVERLLKVIRTEADGGLGVLLVEQRARQALELVDRVYVMRSGHIVMSGTAVEIAENWQQVESFYLGN